MPSPASPSRWPTSSSNRRLARRRWRYVGAIVLVTLVAYLLAVGLCAVGYRLIPEWVCRGSHLTPP
jgi:hypothetical protein